MNEGSADGNGTDGFFGFVVGLYVAAVVTPAVLVGVALRVSADPGVLFSVLLGTVVVVAGAVGRVARRAALAVRLGGSRWLWVAMGLPLTYLVVLLPATLVRGDAPPDPVVPVALFGAMFGFVAGIGLVAASHNRHARSVLADAEELADFRATAPERDRRLAKRVTVGLFAAGIVGFVGSILLDSVALRLLFHLAIPAGAGFYGTTGERRVRVSAVGLVVGTPAHKQFRPWSAYESYAVTDEAVIVRRTGWSAWGLRDLHRDATELDDPEAVDRALGKYLPRRA